MFRNAARAYVRTGVNHFRRFSAGKSLPGAEEDLPLATKGCAAAVGAICLGITVSEAAGWFGTPVATNMDSLKKDIITAIEAEDAKRGDGTSIAPTLIRLAWHAAGTYSVFDKTGGSNGATMRFAPECNWGANAGLAGARTFLEGVKKKHSISYADLWTFAGGVAVEHMGGPSISWRPGRTDADKGTVVPDGRLPGANSGCPAATNSHIRDIFYRMGFNDQEIVALIGAHAVGRCHLEASGFWGPWTNAESTFSNEYFRLLVEEKWTEKKTHEGKPWKGPMQYENKDGTLMMLPADLWLMQDKEFRKWVELYAKDEAKFFADFAAAFTKLMELGCEQQLIKKK